MKAGNISQDSSKLISYISLSAIMTTALGAGGYVVGLIVTKIFPTSPLFPLVFGVSQATSIALNAAILIFTENDEKKERTQKYKIVLLEAAGYALVGTATTVCCLALDIFGPPMALAIGGQTALTFNKLLEARNEYKKFSKNLL